MRPSHDRLADDNVGVRASDAERDHAIGELRNRFAEGRLSQETFLCRMDAALNARDRSDLSDLFTDLPVPAPERSTRRLRDKLASLIRPARAAGSGTRLLSVQRPAELPAQTAALPPLRLPPQPDRRFTIGRALACDFTLADLSVSRWHARLHTEGDEWLLSDLGSTNGTRLNGWRVTTGVPVKPGDQVTFGSVSFVITDKPLAAD